MDYEKFFGFKDTPFRLTPDPDYYFPSDVHRAALDTLQYAIRAREGFMQIVGAPGTGKTLTLRTLVKQLGPDVSTATIFNPRLSSSELLKAILDDLDIAPARMEELDRETLIRYFRDYLLAQNEDDRVVVVIIDEAQNLPAATLEELRLLSNLETEKRKLLQIVLVGQPELDDKLAEPELTQLNQRITVRYRLQPLSRQDTTDYIHHRLRIAGGGELATFTPVVLKDIYKASRGIPRVINIICERALMAAFVDGRNRIEKNHFKRALNSISGEPLPRRAGAGEWLRPRNLIIGVLLVALGLLLAEGVRHGLGRAPAVEPAPPVTKPAEPAAPQPAPEPVPPAPESAPPVVETPPAPQAPTPPAAAVHVPDQRFFLALPTDGDKALLWQGEAGGPVLRGAYSWPRPPAPGIYLMCSVGGDGPVLFRHPVSEQSPIPTSGDIWREVGDLLQTSLLPVVVYDPASPPAGDLLGRAAGMRDSLKQWAESWRKKDINRHMGYYGDTFYSYGDDLKSPTSYSRTRLRGIKSQIFERSNRISLEMTEPVTILDPARPDRGLVVFNQKYESDVYSDEGTQALFLDWQPQTGQAGRWVIVAKFWTPLSGR